MIEKIAKKFLKILLVFLLLFLINCTKISDKSQKEIFIDNEEDLIKIYAEIADDNQEKIRGLMFREKLEENSGMFFIFENESYQTFWMKNTLVPLDIIFIDKGFKIVGIESAQPCRKEPCKLYVSPVPAKYVLEVNVGFTARNKIEIGDKIIMK